MNHYQTLGITPDANAATIKAAYRAAAAAAHPDREGGSTERMAAVNAAWEVLGDATARGAYDERDPARERLIKLFESYLEQGGTNSIEGIVARCRRLVDGAIVELQGHQRRDNGKLARLERDLKRVKGPLLWVKLCNKHIEATRRSVVEADEQIAINRAVLVLLQEYEDTGEVGGWPSPMDALATPGIRWVTDPWRDPSV